MAHPTVFITTDTQQGCRPYQEDRINVTKLADGRIAAVVCDGHGGYAAAEYVSTHVMKSLQKIPPFDWNLQGVLQKVADGWTAACLTELGATKFPTTEQERKEIFHNAKPEYFARGFSSGTTAILAIIDVGAKRGMVANIGDSRCVFKDFGAAKSRLKTTRDHVPKESDLGPIGGKVIKMANNVSRINGDLACGRAIGDMTAELMGSVSNKSDLIEFSWETGPFKMVLGSDGVFGPSMKNPKILAMSDASQVVREALLKGSTDNVSAIMIEVVYS